MVTEQEARAALMRHGEYREEPDAFEWLMMESADVAAAANSGVPGAVIAVLIDTAFCDPTDAASVARAQAVHRDLRRG